MLIRYNVHHGGSVFCTFLPTNAVMAYRFGKNDKGEPVSKPCLTRRDCAEPQICDQETWFSPGVCKVGHRMDYSKRRIRPIIYHMGADTPAGEAWRYFTAFPPSTSQGHLKRLEAAQAVSPKDVPRLVSDAAFAIPGLVPQSDGMTQEYSPLFCYPYATAKKAVAAR